MRVRKKFKEIEWSSRSMVHNLFRVFEYVCGRKRGIRLESRTTQCNGMTMREFYTVEAALAHYEAVGYQVLYDLFNMEWARAVKRLRVKVHIPKLAGIPNPQGYLFAIAVDTTSSLAVGGAGGSPQTFSHTTSGSDRALVCAAHWSTGTDTVSATYNGVSMTNEGQVAANARGVGILSLTAPNTGANTVEVTYGSNGDEFFSVSSFTGVDQTDSVEATGSVTGSYSTSYPKNISVTTLTDNAVIVGAATDRENGITGAASPATDLFYKLWSDAPENTITGGSAYRTTTTAGAYTIGWAGSGNNFINGVALALTEAEVASGFLGMFALVEKA